MAFKGKKLTEEHKRKISKANTGKKHSEKSKKKMSKAKMGHTPWNKGIPWSEETKRKISKGKKGQASFLGKKHSKESNRKNREAHLGKIPWNKGKTGVYSEESLEKMRGKNNKFWKGGITPINQQIRNSFKYKAWRKKVFGRDYYTCVWCGQYGDKLNADHIIPFSKIIEKLIFEQGIDNLYKKAMKYDLLWDINNGRTLCVDCHRKTDTYAKNIIK